MPMKRKKTRKTRPTDKAIKRNKKDTVMDPLREIAASIDPALIQRMKGGQPDEQTGGWSE